MKFANLLIKGQATVALVNTETKSYWLVSELIPGFSGNMIQLVQQYETIKGQLKPKGAGAPLDGARILAPITQPLRNIFCVGKNYHAHAAEFAKSGFDSSAKEGEHAPEAPVIFTKPVSTIIGPGDKIPPHLEVTQQLDYEAELTVIIGKGGRGIKKADAFGHVFGYTIVNDVTARDLQKLHRQWFLGKALDGFCPMGPYIVTSDEIAGDDLTIQCWVNGELRQNSHTSLLIFDIPTLIETISAGITLQAGDIIATGTPAGVGIGATPPKFLKPGDVVKMAVQGIGTLENTVG
jgi:2-keto-4-pentenoate hydratase/2-oxohepta-3-ene-1,7-dioic acid hydratase in catechol pathway